jgi:hypothetical protein
LVCGAVRADEEVRAAGGQSAYARGKDAANRVVIAALPARHAPGERYAVKGHVLVIVRADLGELDLAQRSKAERRSFHTVRQNSYLPHGAS